MVVGEREVDQEDLARVAPAELSCQVQGEGGAAGAALGRVDRDLRRGGTGSGPMGAREQRSQVAVALSGSQPQSVTEGGAGGGSPGNHVLFEHQQLQVGQGAAVGGHRILEQQGVDAHEVAWAECQQRERLRRCLGSELADAFLDDSDRRRRPGSTQDLTGNRGLLAQVASDPAQDLLGNGKEERDRL